MSFVATFICNTKLTTLCKFLGDLGISVELDIVIRLIFHEDGAEVDIVTHFISSEVKVSLF